jgi:hypothetical protein
MIEARSSALPVLVACLLGSQTFPLAGAETGVVPLDLPELAGVARHGWPVTCGVPFDEGELPALAVGQGRLRVVGPDGNPVPAQFRVTARHGDYPYGPGPFAKWVLVSFMATVGADETAYYSLEWGPDPALPPDTGLSVGDVAGATAIRNGSGPGAMLVVIDSARYDALLESVTLDEKGDGFADDRPLLTESARGSSAIAYEAADGRRSGQLGHHAAEVTVEEAGPVRAVVRVASAYDDSFATVVRYTVYAGLPSVFIQKTLLRTPARDPSAQQPITLREYAVTQPLGLLESCDVTVGTGEADDDGTGDTTWTTTEPGMPVVLEQDVVEAPGRGPLGFGMDPGGPLYGVRRGSAIKAYGGSAPGWIEIKSGPRTVVAACRPFADGRPRRMRVGDGALTVELLAEVQGAGNSMAAGSSITQSLMLYFPFGGEAVKPEAAAASFRHPLRVALDAERLARAELSASDGLGEGFEEAEFLADGAPARLSANPDDVRRLAAYARLTGDPWATESLTSALSACLAAPEGGGMGQREILQRAYEWSWDPRWYERAQRAAAGVP